MTGHWSLTAALAGVQAGLFVTAAAELALGTWWLTRWRNRDISTAALVRQPWVTLRFLLPTVVAVLASLRYDAPGLWVIAALTWVAVVSLITDLTCLKIPREPSWAALGFGALVVFLSAPPAGIASFAAGFLGMFTILLLILVLSRGGLGSGDMRLLLAFTPVAAWVGYTPLLAGLLIGAVGQFPLRFVLRRFGLFNGKGYPFAPALVIGFTVAIMLYGDPTNPCLEWVQAFTC